MAVILPSGKAYAPTADDRTWLLRAVQREGQPRRLVAQTLVNRFAWLHSRGHYPTLASFVRAYAQPVNPRWYPEGDLHRAAVSTIQNKPDLSSSQKRDQVAELEKRAAARRDVVAVSSRFDPPVVEAVDRALELGAVDLEPGTVHFAAPTIRRAWPVTHESASASENRFYKERDGRSGTFLYSVAAAVASVAPPPARARTGVAAILVGFFIALFSFGRRRRG